MDTCTFAQELIHKRIKVKLKCNSKDSFQFYSESYSDSGYNDYCDHSDYYDAS